MLQRLEAIQFNHNSSGVSGDAFNIRKNEHEFVDVPEWRHGVSTKPEHSPAAYALSETQGNTLTIKASFSIDVPSNQDVSIRAVDANLHREALNGSHLSAGEVELFENLVPNRAGNVLGEVTATPLTLSAGQTEFQCFSLQSVRIWDAGVGVHDIVWRWQYLLSGTTDWIDLAITTHRIYTVVSIPKDPWKERCHDRANTQLPWVAVLEHACKWAAGAHDTNVAATAITERVHALGPEIIFYGSQGSTYYTDREAFDCSSFLARLRGEQGKGKRVNCADCAAIVSTFANVVGCDLSQMCIRPIGQTFFRLQPHIRIGVLGAQIDMRFYHHQVASEGCGDEAEVFDACLQITSSSSVPGVFTLPTNLPLAGKMGYLFRLVAKRDQRVTQAHPNCKRRSLGAATGFPLSCTNRAILERHFNFASWELSVAAGNSLFVSGFFFPNFIVSNLQLAGLQQSNLGRTPSTTHSFWLGLGTEETLLRIEVYETASWREARKGVMTILTALEEFGIERREIQGIGDVTFSDPEFEQILFAVGNLVFFVRNCGSESVPLVDIARRIAQQVLSPPPLIIEDPGLPGAVRRFNFATSQATVDVEIKLEEKPAHPSAPERFYQFFSDRGEISLEGRELRYRPKIAGEHTVKIFATDVQGKAVIQALPLEVQ